MHASQINSQRTTAKLLPMSTTTASTGSTTTLPLLAPNNATTTMSPPPSLSAPSIRANTIDYLQCLNSRHFHLLPIFLSPTSIKHNSRHMTPAEYTSQLRATIASAPDMTFRLGQIAVDAESSRVACVLAVEGTPEGEKFRGHEVKEGARGKKVRWFEQVVWVLDAEGRIEGVESAVEAEAVRRQCARKGGKTN